MASARIVRVIRWAAHAAIPASTPVARQRRERTVLLKKLKCQDERDVLLKSSVFNQQSKIHDGSMSSLHSWGWSVIVEVHA